MAGRAIEVGGVTMMRNALENIPWSRQRLRGSPFGTKARGGRRPTQGCVGREKINGPPRRAALRWVYGVTTTARGAAKTAGSDGVEAKRRAEAPTSPS